MHQNEKFFGKFTIIAFCGKIMRDWNRVHIEPVKSDATETMQKLQNRSKFSGLKPFGYFDCLASNSQPVTFQKTNLIRILCTRAFSFK